MIKGLQRVEKGTFAFRTEFASIYEGKSEVIVFGEGFSWIVRYANTTNPHNKWTGHFETREEAEEFAQKVALEPFPTYLDAFRSERE